MLRSDTQGRLLARILADPAKEHNLTELVAWTGSSMPTVSREVDRAEQAGISSSATSSPTAQPASSAAGSTPSAGSAPGTTVRARVLTSAVEATMEVDATLPDHTIYRPVDLDAVKPLPILAWGEGTCQLPGDAYKNLLTEIAGRGYLVVAGREPGKPGPDSPELMTAAIDWAIAENARSGSKYQGTLDTTQIATSGHSCGGLIALHVAATDPRVTSVLPINSGIFDAGTIGGASKSDVGKLRSPTMWLNTGPSDIAHPQAVTDYATVPADVPAVFANYDLSERGNALTGAHMGTAFEPGGGEEGRAAIIWLDMTLKASPEARAQLLPPQCQLCADPKWTVETKHWK